MEASELVRQIERGCGSNGEFSDAYIQMMWLLFLRCPGVDIKDDSGAYYLGEIGVTREKNWQKATPYSIAETR